MSDDPPMDRFRGPEDGAFIRRVPVVRRSLTDKVWDVYLREAHERRIREKGVCGRESCPICTPRRTE